MNFADWAGWMEVVPLGACGVVRACVALETVPVCVRVGVGVGVFDGLRGCGSVFVGLEGRWENVDGVTFTGCRGDSLWLCRCGCRGG